MTKELTYYDERDILGNLGRILLTQNDWDHAHQVLCRFQYRIEALIEVTQRYKVTTILSNNISQLNKYKPGSINQNLLSQVQNAATSGSVGERIAIAYAA